MKWKASHKQANATEPRVMLAGAGKKPNMLNKYIYIVAFLTTCFSVDAKNDFPFNKADSLLLGRINCKISCHSDAFFCDTVAVLRGGKFATTLELPLNLLSLAEKDSFRLCNDKSSKLIDSYKVFNGSYNCYSPKLALLFYRKSKYIGQLMIDIDCGNSVFYSSHFKRTEIINFTRQNIFFKKLSIRYNILCR